MSYRGRVFYGSNDPINSDEALKEDRVLRIRLHSQHAGLPHRTHNNTTMQYETKTHNKMHTDKHKWIYAQWNWPSVTKPKPENCKNCSPKCAYDRAQLQHNITQYSSNNLPSYLQRNIIAQMLSIRGEGALMRIKIYVYTSTSETVMLKMDNTYSELTLRSRLGVCRTWSM